MKRKKIMSIRIITLISIAVLISAFTILVKNLFLTNETQIQSYSAIAQNMNTETSAQNTSEKLSDWQKAFKEVAYSYYMRGTNIQYHSMKVAYFSPEEATSQNMNYLVCSGLTRNVYNE